MLSPDDHNVSQDDNGTRLVKHFGYQEALIGIRAAFSADTDKVRVRYPGFLDISQPRFHRIQLRYPQQFPRILDRQALRDFQNPHGNNPWRRAQTVQSDTVLGNAQGFKLRHQVFPDGQGPELRMQRCTLVKEAAENAVVSGIMINGSVDPIGRERGPANGGGRNATIGESLGGGLGNVEEALS